MYVAIHIEKHSKFSRRGSNLYTIEQLSFPEAALGTRIDVRTIDGQYGKLKIPEDLADGEYIFYSKVSYENISAAGGDKLVVVSEEELAAPKDYSLIWIFVIIILIIIVILVFLRQHHKKIKQLGKKTAKQGNGRKRHKKKKVLEKENIDKKLNALEKGYKAGYISNKTYNKAKKGLRR